MFTLMTVWMWQQYWNNSEIAAMVNRNRSGMTEEESNDECDMEIIKPTRSELKNAVKLIEQHLLLSQNGSDHPSGESKWSGVVLVQV